MSPVFYIPFTLSGDEIGLSTPIEIGAENAIVGLIVPSVGASGNLAGNTMLFDGSFNDLPVSRLRDALGDEITLTLVNASWVVIPAGALHGIQRLAPRLLLGIAFSATFQLVVRRFA